MRHSHRTMSLAALALTATAAFSCPTLGQETAAELPTAEDLFMKCMTAMGGEAGWEEVKSFTHKVIADEMVGFGEVTVHASQPDKLRCDVSIPGEGSGQVVMIGDEGWAKEPGGSGEYELIDREHEASFIARLLAPQAFFLMSYKNFPKHETTGEETFHGNACYRVKMTTEDDVQSFDLLFSTETGLCNGFSFAGPDGLPFEVVITKYAEVDGIKLMSTSEFDFGMGPAKFEYNDYSFNAVPDDAFAVPDEVKKLQAEAEAEGGGDDGNADDDGGDDGGN